MRFSIYILVLFLALPAVGQSDFDAIEQLSSDPIGFKQKANIFTEPPTGQVRIMAEWEELQAVAVTWDLAWTGSRKSTMASIIAAILPEVDVWLYYSGQDIYPEARVKYELTSRGVPLDRIHFFETTFNGRIWIRDFGAHTMYRTGTAELAFVDWKYEEDYAEADINISAAMAAHSNTDLYSTMSHPYNLKLDGGNFFTDGIGTTFFSSHVLEDNRISKYRINSILESFMNTSTNIILEKLDYDMIHHIDMHMKLLDEETILVGQYPEGIGDYQRIEDNIAFLLEHYNSPFETEYKIKRIPMPPDRDGNYPGQAGDCSARNTPCYYTYTNALFVNKTILVPQYFDGLGMDQEAIEIWEGLKPGYNIVGINCNDIIGEFGAIHCVTKEIGVSDPLHIVHQKLPDQCVDENQYLIQANITHQTGITNAKLFYTTDISQGFQEEPMNWNFKDRWVASIPKQIARSTVYYYIVANASNGKSIARPLAAPVAFWQFQVDCISTGTETASQPQIKIGHIGPNPTANLVRFQIKNAVGEELKFQIHSVSGKCVLEHSEIISQGNFRFEHHIGNLATGLYFLTINVRNHRRVQRLIVQKEN